MYDRALYHRNLFQPGGPAFSGHAMPMAPGSLISIQHWMVTALLRAPAGTTSRLRRPILRWLVNAVGRDGSTHE